MIPIRKGFWIRSLALAIDLLVAAIVFGACAMLLGSIFTKGFEHQDRAIAVIWWAIFIVVMVIEVIFAQTIGKAVLRISVAKSDCTPASTAALTSRWLMKTWPAWLLIINAVAPNPAISFIASIGGLGMILSFLAVMNDGKQGWHDQITGTAVYRAIDVDGPDTTPGGFEITKAGNDE